jgi:hypothetical protein
MELVHRDAIPYAVTKVIAFADWQKLKAARRKKIAFYEKYPDLDETPSKTTVHREFLANHEQRIVDQVAALWGPKAKPEHWSGINLIERATRCWLSRYSTESFSRFIETRGDALL